MGVRDHDDTVKISEVDGEDYNDKSTRFKVWIDAFDFAAFQPNGVLISPSRSKRRAPHHIMDIHVARPLFVGRELVCFA
jgi:hypothetical protein